MNVVPRLPPAEPLRRAGADIDIVEVPLAPRADPAGAEPVRLALAAELVSGLGEVPALVPAPPPLDWPRDASPAVALEPATAPGAPLREGDIVGAAVAQGARAGRMALRPDASVLRRAGEVAALARDGDTDAALAVLLGLVRAYPASERLQILAARVADAHQPRAPQDIVWEGIHQRFPAAVEPFRLMLRWTMRGLGRDAALQRLRDRFPGLPEDPDDLLLYAWGQEEVRCTAEADAAFERLCVLEGRSEAPYLQFAQALAKRSEIWRACDVLSTGVAQAGATPALVRALEAAAAEREEVERIVPAVPGGRASDAVLGHLFERIAATRPARRRTRRRVGRVVLVTGTLGAGGAERQLTLTAAGLQEAVASREAIAGHRINGPVEVLCRSLKERPGANFFEGALREARVAVHEYTGFPASITPGPASLAGDVRAALRFLPAPVAEGVTHLAEAIRARAPHVIHIWQDGSIFAAGLAAALADVPRIVLGVRSLPPIDRPERYKPEHDVVFRSLLALPGVTLMANSRVAARRYAEWLCLDPDRVAVVHNGVNALATEPTPEDLAMAARFDAATADADYTVGGVMRLDENKRPLLWLEAAARLHAIAPRTRFLIVGDGPLREECLLRAARLGIADRVLFVGRSHRVGFWLGRMDAFVLLSLIEGMPNVLIEAQHAGVPVVTTDAGGAAEAIRPGKTGFLLPAAVSDPDVIVARLKTLREDPARRRAMGEEGRRWANDTFSVRTMLERTVEVFMS